MMAGGTRGEAPLAPPLHRCFPSCRSPGRYLSTNPERGPHHENARRDHGVSVNESGPLKKAVLLVLSAAIYHV